MSDTNINIRPGGMNERAYKLGLIIALLATGVALTAVGDKDSASLAFIAAAFVCIFV